MRIIAGLLQVLAAIVLALGVFLLVADPRLRDLAGEDLSSIFPGAKSSESKSTASKGEPTTASEGEPTTTASNESKASENESAPVVTEGGYTIAPKCALWTVEGLNLYYSPTDTSILCVQPPGGLIQAGTPYNPETEQLPPNCAIAPDSVVYCLAGGELGSQTLQAFYNRGELQTPREPQGGGG